MKMTYTDFEKVVQYKMADIQKFLNSIEVKNDDEKNECISACIMFENMILSSFKGNIKN